MPVRRDKDLQNDDAEKQGRENRDCLLFNDPKIRKILLQPLDESGLVKPSSSQPNIKKEKQVDPVGCNAQDAIAFDIKS